MLKRFLDWIGLKERLHESAHKPPLFKEGEIWWCSIGENIGNEINGKGDRFTRPIFVLRKYDRYAFLGLPLTSKVKTGSWYCQIEFLEKKQTVILMHGRTLDHRRLKEKMGELGPYEIEHVWKSYRALH